MKILIKQIEQAISNEEATPWVRACLYDALEAAQRDEISKRVDPFPKLASKPSVYCECCGTEAMDGEIWVVVYQDDNEIQHICPNC